MVYPAVLLIHTILRWLVLGSLLAALGSSFRGWLQNRPYRPIDQTLRIVATSIAHTQLLVGIYLYVISPVVNYYWRFRPGFTGSLEFPFFGFIHIGLMLTAVVIMTIGSSKAKRQTEAGQKFKTTAIYFTISLIIILLAIPWPFSPLAARPWLRNF